MNHIHDEHALSLKPEERHSLHYCTLCSLFGKSCKEKKMNPLLKIICQHTISVLYCAYSIIVTLHYILNNYILKIVSEEEIL